MPANAHTQCPRPDFSPMLCANNTIDPPERITCQRDADYAGTSCGGRSARGRSQRRLTPSFTLAGCWMLWIQRKRGGGLCCKANAGLGSVRFSVRPLRAPAQPHGPRPGRIVGVTLFVSLVGGELQERLHPPERPKKARNLIPNGKPPGGPTMAAAINVIKHGLASTWNLIVHGAHLILTWPAGWDLDGALPYAPKGEYGQRFRPARVKGSESIHPLAVAEGISGPGASGETPVPATWAWHRRGDHGGQTSPGSGTDRAGWTGPAVTRRPEHPGRTAGPPTSSESPERAATRVAHDARHAGPPRGGGAIQPAGLAHRGLPRQGRAQVQSHVEAGHVQLPARARDLLDLPVNSCGRTPHGRSHGGKTAARSMRHFPQVGAGDDDERQCVRMARNL
jgi:hypothetical protein